jgi:hypothetical protein
MSSHHGSINQILHKNNILKSTTMKKTDYLMFWALLAIVYHDSDILWASLLGFFSFIMFMLIFFTYEK